MGQGVKLAPDEADHEVIVMGVEPVTGEPNVVREIRVAVPSAQGPVLSQDPRLLLGGEARKGTGPAQRLALLEHYVAISGRGKRVRQLLAGSVRHLLVACMPKSGSTFSSTALAYATGFSLETLGWGYDQNEQDLYPPALVRK